MLARVFLLTALAFHARAAAFDQLWQEAVALHQKGEYEAAAAKYSEILSTRPEYVPALSNLGAVFSRTGRFELASTQYRKALDLQPAHSGIRLNLALVFYNQGRLSEAIVELERLHRDEPAKEQVALLLADCWLRTGENRKAISLLEDRESSDDRAVAYLLGSALIRDTQVTRGQRIIDRLFRDESAEALMLLAAAQIAAQENKKALATLGQALAKNPILPELNSLYGRARLTDGDAAGAKEAFLRELAINPSEFEANLQIGALYRLEKDNSKAAEFLGRAQQIRPQSLPLKYQLASLEFSKGNIQGAIPMLEEVTREAPDFVEAHITLATAYYRAKRKEDGDRERALVDQINAKQQTQDQKD